MLFYGVVLLLVIKNNIGLSQTANNLSSPCTDHNHLLLVPGVLTSGGSSRACVSRFYVDGPATLLLSLATEDGKSTTSWRDLPPGDGGCLDISVPQLPNTKAELNVQLSYPEVQCTWQRQLSLRIASGRVIITHTERARYRPGETVRIRAFVLKVDLTPAHGVIDELWLEGPEGAWSGVRVAQWTRSKLRLGVTQVQHELDEGAPPGKWTLRARMADGTQGSSTFWVGNYELPPFQLSVKHPRKVLRTSERLVWTVCVRYPWSEAVEGMLVIRLRGSGGGAGGGAGVRTAARRRAPRACLRHAAAPARVGLRAARPPDVLIADFSFQEEGTRVWQNLTVVSQVVDQAISLDFVTKEQSAIAPGLPFKLKVKATRFDDKPASSIPLRICHRPSSTQTVHNILPTPDTGNPSNSFSPGSDTGNTVCEESITDGKGVARIIFMTNGAHRYYQFQASLSNDSSITSPPLLLTVQTTSSSAILGSVKLDSESSRSFVPLYLKVHGDQAVTVHFVVLTRGGVIYRWGATTQCPVSTHNQILTVPRNSKCHPSSASYSLTNPDPITNVSIKLSELTDFHYPRIMLPIKISHQMCPDSHMIAYFYHNGELVTASKHFEMEECFGKVEATWSSRQVAPGSNASLQISTPGPALCATTVLDSSAKFLTPTPGVGDIMMEGLRRLVEGNRNLTEYDAAGECFLTSDSPSQPSNSQDLLASWMSSAGVRVVGAGVQVRQCDIQAPAPMVNLDNAARSDFSEAWLWKLVPVSYSSSAVTSSITPQSITRYEASVVCVSRTGVAVSPPAVLQVFREFFIHLDTTNRLRRGDSTIMKYRIFNYLYQKICVKITLHSSPHISLEDSTESVCIEPRSCISRRSVGTAVQSGEATVAVRGSREGGNVDVSDEVVVQITVEPEGFPVTEQKAIMLCGQDSADPTRSKVTWDWPSVQSVPNTEYFTMWAAGDITAPLLASSDSLVSLPRGCGEQNLARLATNLVALDQLDSKCSAYTYAKMHVDRGFTRQLQYAHPWGGFSAFGSSDPTPSTWLTAFAVRYMRRAYQVLSPGLPVPPVIEKAEQWLVSQQMENGCFRNEGQVFHRELKGGLSIEGSVASVALTAYVISSLVQSTIILPSKTLKNSLHCLRALPVTKTKNKIYATALITNAFVNIKKYEEDLMKRNDAENMYEKKEIAGLEQDEDMWQIVELLKMAKKSEDYVWWETESLSTSIEATGLALSTLCTCPSSLQLRCETSARGAAKWLASNMKREGGFLSTQDTLVALEALSKWSSIQPSHTNLTLNVESDSWHMKMPLTSGTNVPSVVGVPVGKQLKVRAEGSGCAVIHATRSYNVISTSPTQDSTLRVQVSVHTDGAFHCSGGSCFCAATIQSCVLWTKGFPEMAVMEVSLPAGYGADAAKLYSQLNQPDSLIRRIELTRSSNKATFYLTSTASSAGHACMSVHSVGPQLPTGPASVRVMDYYNPADNDTKMYTIPEDCPAPISHENEQYLRSDNLFNKAKSLSDDEPVIAQEFSFEDIPEGIPLEDPMYPDYLTKDNSNTQHRNTGNKTSDFEMKHHQEKQNKVSKDGYIVEDNTNTQNDKTIEIKVAETNNEPLKHETERDTLRFENTRLPHINIQIQNVKNKVATRTHEAMNEIESRSDNVSGHNKENKVENPKLTDFHVIESDKDLDVPTGVEGPVPVFMLPPAGFVAPTTIPEENEQTAASTYRESSRQFYFHYGHSLRNVL